MIDRSLGIGERDRLASMDDTDFNAEIENGLEGSWKAYVDARDESHNSYSPRREFSTLLSRVVAFAEMRDRRSEELATGDDDGFDEEDAVESSVVRGNDESVESREKSDDSDDDDSPGDQDDREDDDEDDGADGDEYEWLQLVRNS